jgi:hypothetical protein
MVVKFSWLYPYHLNCGSEIFLTRSSSSQLCVHKLLVLFWSGLKRMQFP